MLGSRTPGNADYERGYADGYKQGRIDLRREMGPKPGRRANRITSNRRGDVLNYLRDHPGATGQDVHASLRREGKIATRRAVAAVLSRMRLLYNEIYATTLDGALVEGRSPPGGDRQFRYYVK